MAASMSWTLRPLAGLLAGVLVASACSGGDADDAVGEDAVEQPSSSSSATEVGDGEAVNSATTESVPVTGGILTVLIQEDAAPFVGWTPWDHVCAWACRNVIDQVLETLTVVLPDGSVEPWLAESVTPNSELTSWTVVLRDGISFTDGQALTAPQVKEGYDEFVKEGKATEGLLREARIVGLEAPDDRTLVYALSEPNAGFPAALAGPAGRVFSVDAARSNAAAFLRGPIGTGPFAFEDWDVGQQVRLRANEDYWRSDDEGNELPLADGLHFVQVADEQERLERLRGDEGHVSQTRAPRAIQQARESQFTVVSSTEDNIGVIVFNTLEPPYDDPRVRRALLLASDQQTLLEASGVADVTPPATQWWSNESIWYSDRAADAWPTTDVEEARRLLQEYIDDPLRSDELDPGLPIEVAVQCTDDLQLANMVRSLSEQWQSTGLVVVEPETVSRSGIIQRVMGAITDRPSFSGDFTASCWRFGGESDPWALLATATGPVKTSPLNVANLESDRVTQLVALVQQSPTLAARRAAIEQVMLTFALEVPAIYLGHATSAVIGSDEVEGLGSWSLPDGRQVFGYSGGVGRYDELVPR